MPRTLVLLLGALSLSIAPHARAADAPNDKDAAVPAHQPHPLDSNAPAPHGGKTIELKIGDKSARGYVAFPYGPTIEEDGKRFPSPLAPRGGVLVLHEWWGLNDWIKHEVTELAAEGYVVLAVDLYQGKVASDPESAQKLMGALDRAWAAEVEKAGFAWLREQAPGKKLATIGWCMGGGESLQASLANAGRWGNELAATVIYYGMPVSDPARLAALKGDAVLGIFAKRDGWITPDKVDAFDKALTAAGVQHELHSYDADHAFANPSGGKHNPAAAQDAWERTRAFLAAHLK